ncbi:beta-galactosidase [Actinocrispum wychmicini]|uniref:beta-galactosidase n=1 Tax=Actinocrispum wychmicini TaxID=1213861 RepID=A0A4R2IUP6_9PSEU|nr:beta-galactosidase [Actinocrispum wychmicini]TCO48787.1 alpha-galactosidase-like protein [Actinocrispum wychmicini]
MGAARWSAWTRQALRAAVAALLLLLGTAVPTGAAPTAAQPAGHTVSYDGYSFMIDGQRTYLWSGEFHYWRLPSPGLWRDVLEKMKAGGFNAVSIYFDWGFHSPAPGVYDFTGIRDMDRLLDIARDVGIYVIARPGPYINAETDSGGFPGWLTTQPGRARSTAPDYLAAADEWLSKIDPILARHQLTNGTGSVILYQVENEFYDPSGPARDYMTHLERKAQADGITVPLTGNHNGTFSSGAGALDVDGPDSYPQGFNCSNPTAWHGLSDITYARVEGKPLYSPEFQGGSFDPWGGPGYDKCRQLTGPDFVNVFYKNNIAVGATAQSFYMTYGGTSWGWLADPSQVYTSYDYGAPITESRQLGPKYDADKRIGYFTQAVAPLAKTDQLAVTAPSSAAVVDTARINPDDHTQFHTLRHSDPTSTSTDDTHIAIDLGARSTYTHDDVAAELAYSGTWSHVGPEQNYTSGDFRHTESFSQVAGDSVTVPFTGTGVRWVSSKDPSHGVADVYLDGTKVATVDGYAPNKVFQQVLYAASGLADTQHTLRIVVTGQRNPRGTAPFVVVDAVDVPPTGSVYYPSVPQQPGTAITLAGRDSKILVAGYQMGDQRLRYSTSEIMTHAQIGAQDVALLYGRAGQAGETVLQYDTKPTVTVLDGSVESTWDADRGDLRLNYTHTGLARVLVTGGKRPLLLLLGTDETASTFWRQDTASGPILVRGPSLVRSANGLALTGDTTAAGDLEVFAAQSGDVRWNGVRVATQQTASGSRLGRLGGPAPVTLPALTSWRYKAESPEAQPGFDDSRWQVATKTSSPSTTAPGTLPVLFADDYGFHYGDVWYRGRFRGTGKETGITLAANTGRAGAWSVWLNGTFLGTSNTARNTFTFPAALAGKDNVVSVLVENMGHNEDYGSNDTHKEARGLTGAVLTGAPLTALTWRIQGQQGSDPVRGPMNNGGLFGERAGWSQPGFPDGSWQPATLPNTDRTPGVAWYRTTANLDLPRGQDTSVGIRIDDDPARHYRAQIFVNGWQLGRYVNDLGPQHSFPIPTGILKPNGANTIAIAVWNTDGTGGLGKVSLESYGTQATGLQVPTVESPRYDPFQHIPALNLLGVSATAPNTVEPGQVVDVSAQVSAVLPVAGVTTDLALPAGWTAVPTSPTKLRWLLPGRPATVSWRVTVPASAVAQPQPLSVSAHLGRFSATDTRIVRGLPVPPTTTSLASALPFLTATNGWGPAERDTSNGENGAGDGRPITLRGTVHPKGLGAHADSDIGLYLAGHCSRFTATVGVDDETHGGGSVTFAVVADGTTVYTSPTLTGTSAPLAVDVPLAGAQVVDLVVGAAGDGNGLDHADWADAQVTCSPGER